MSLVGNLEDLSLVEILQIVSLSKKSGTLTLRSRDREAAIVFRCGQVVRASSSMFPQSLGELLTRSAVIDPTILRKALALQQAEGFLERLGSILVKHFNISQEIIEDVVRNQVERVIMSLFEWTSGSFDFQIQDLVETVYDTRMDPLQFMLAQGLNPQYLAMEGMQAMDDKREAIARGDYDNKEEYDEDTGEIEAADAGLLTPDAKKQPLVVVDDDAPTLQAVATVMRELGHQVVAMSRSEDALIKIDGLIREGARPTILIDLIMPKMDGSGVLGGIELMELLHNNFKNLRMIVMTDYQHADAEAKVLERGYLYLLKPRRAEIGKPEQVKEFAGRLQSELQRIQGLMGASNQPERYNLGDDLRLELDDDVSGIGFLGDSSVTEAPTLLKCMLDELENSDQQGGVLLLVLRFASEFMNRAIIFMVHDRIVSGVGQFGISDGKISGDDKVRGINFPLEADSIFGVPGKNLRPVVGKLDITPMDAYLFKQLGGGVPAEAFIGPIVHNGELIGFLYGDNLPDNAPLKGTDNLEIFLSRAGTMLEHGLGQQSMR